jgi:hypothetical protein
MPEMIMVAQQQILMPFSKNKLLIMLCRQQDHSVALHPSTEERDSKAEYSNHVKQVKYIVMTQN